MVLFVLFPVDNEKDNIFVLVDHLLFLLQHLVVVELSAVARLLPLAVETPAQVEHQRLQGEARRHQPKARQQQGVEQREEEVEQLVLPQELNLQVRVPLNSRSSVG